MAKVELNTRAPEFTLPDFNGKSVSLSDFAERKNVLVVFNRGFRWPFCRRHMAQLRQDYQHFVNLDTEIIVVGPEEAEPFRKYWIEGDLPFIGLPDPEHKILKLYGQEVKLFKLGRMPAQMLIDKSGMLRYVHYGHSMEDIPSNEEIMNLIKQ
jgi:peroxiredoxin